VALRLETEQRDETPAFVDEVRVRVRVTVTVTVRVRVTLTV
jgi:hypothetical protein